MSLLNDIKQKTNFSPNAWFMLTHVKTGDRSYMEAEIKDDTTLDYINRYKATHTVSQISKDEFDRLNKRTKIRYLNRGQMADYYSIKDTFHLLMENGIITQRQAENLIWKYSAESFKTILQQYRSGVIASYCNNPIILDMNDVFISWAWFGTIFSKLRQTAKDTSLINKLDVEIDSCERVLDDAFFNNNFIEIDFKMFTKNA